MIEHSPQSACPICGTPIEIGCSHAKEKSENTESSEKLDLSKLMAKCDQIWKESKFEYGHFSEDDLKQAVEKFLIQHGLIEQEDISSKLIEIDVEINTKVINRDEIDVDDIKYEAEALIYIFIDRDAAFAGADEYRDKNDSSGNFLTKIYVEFDYSYVGDLAPKLKKTNISCDYEY